jgi:hypothetical protein
MSEPCNLGNMRIWIEALESGNYNQIQNVLRESDPFDRPLYCCLGVATYLATRAGVTPPVQAPGSCDDSRDDHWHDFWCQLTDEVLPVEVSAWLGITETDPVLYVSDFDDPGRATTTASGFNDSIGEGFPEIAWRLRRRYLPESEWIDRPSSKETEQ